MYYVIPISIYVTLERRRCFQIQVRGVNVLCFKRIYNPRVYVRLRSFGASLGPSDNAYSVVISL